MSNKVSLAPSKQSRRRTHYPVPSETWKEARVPILFGLVVARRREKTGKQDIEDDTNQILGNKERWKRRRRTTAGWMGGPAHVASVGRSSRRPVPPIPLPNESDEEASPQIVGSCMYTPPLSFSGFETWPHRFTGSRTMVAFWSLVGHHHHHVLVLCSWFLPKCACCGDHRMKSKLGYNTLGSYGAVVC